MKKIIIYLLATLTIFSITACQATPEKPLVVGKNDNKLESAFNSSVTPQNDEKYPETYSMNIDTGKDNYKIYADATVVTPNTNNFPVTRVRPDAHTQEEVDRVYKYFYKDEKPFERDSERTKGELEKLLIEAKRDLNSKGYSGDDLEGLKQSIKLYEKALATAPAKFDKKYITTKLQDVEGLKLFEADIDMGFLKYSNVYAVNRMETYHSSITATLDWDRYFLMSAELFGETPKCQNMTVDEAKNAAQTVLRDLDLEGFGVVDVCAGVSQTNENQGYVVTFNKTVNGLILSERRIINSKQNDNYASRWNGENITIRIDDKGISVFDWYNKTSIPETLSENVQLLPFSEISGIFEQQLKNKYIFDEDLDSYQSKEVYVDRIVLEYSCVPEKNGVDSYLYIPVWSFYGDVIEVYLNGDEIKQNSGDKTSCHLRINAIDGSVVGI